MVCFILFSLALFLFSYASAIHIRWNPQCQNFKTTFPASSVADSSSYADRPFVAISPPGSYNAGSNGLELYLQKPDGAVHSKDGVNDRTADGATVNSTFTFLHGKVTYEVLAPAVAGVVTAVIFMADEHDEIDVELLGGDPAHWQTNVFAPTPEDSSPHFGDFSSVERVNSITKYHSYFIDWNAERIIWGVDGQATRTLTKGQTYKNGVTHYPSHAVRLQLGIWDASNPAGTSDWARGPIDWNTAPEQITAVVKSVTLECS